MMRTIQLFILLLVLSGLLLCCGCEMPALNSSQTQTQTQQSDLAPQQPTSALAPTPQRQNADPGRFQTSAQGQSALDEAIELSKKFAALSEKMAGLQAEKEQLAVENSQLKEQIAKLKPEAERARKELAEANDLLVEMRLELNNWKSDVLGFREEIREADKIQLEALLKILRVLGGEEAPVPAVENATDAAAEKQ